MSLINRCRLCQDDASEVVVKGLCLGCYQASPYHGWPPFFTDRHVEWYEKNLPRLKQLGPPPCDGLGSRTALAVWKELCAGRAPSRTEWGGWVSGESFGAARLRRLGEEGWQQGMLHQGGILENRIKWYPLDAAQGQWIKQVLQEFVS